MTGYNLLFPKMERQSKTDNPDCFLPDYTPNDNGASH